MTAFKYVGDDERELPGDGLRPSLLIKPGDTVDSDVDLTSALFVPVDAKKPDPPAPVAVNTDVKE